MICHVYGKTPSYVLGPSGPPIFVMVVAKHTVMFKENPDEEDEDLENDCACCNFMCLPPTPPTTTNSFDRHPSR
jgi:hypothetical protein